jgi:hypothetical protein
LGDTEPHLKDGINTDCDLLRVVITGVLFFIPVSSLEFSRIQTEAFEKHIAALALKLDVYEKILSKQKYIAGDVCTHNYVNRSGAKFAPVPDSERKRPTIQLRTDCERWLAKQSRNILPIDMFHTVNKRTDIVTRSG